ncbi:MAG: ferredoxin family protein [Oscillospiraceae bacterium]
MPPVINKNKCIKCHRCVEICPMDVFGVQKEKNITPAIRFPQECWHCNACALDCPAHAIRLRIPVPDMMVYYNASGSK